MQTLNLCSLFYLCAPFPREYTVSRGVPVYYCTRIPLPKQQKTLTLIETILRGCNSRSEGVHFSSKGGCSSRFEGVHYSTREDSNKPRALNLRSFHFCWDSSLDFCAALEFECHPSVRPGGIFYGFAKLFNFSVPLPSNKRNCRQKRTQRNGQSIQHEQKRHQI